jgi:hypothetical protein
LPRFFYTVCSDQLKSIETDNVYIKSLIISEIRKNSFLDITTKDYILSRGKTDANYIVRKKATEFDAENKLVGTSQKRTEEK